MGSFEHFKTRTHFNSLKWLVDVTALAALAVKLLTIALATAAGGGTPLDLLARVPASVADLGAALLVFEVLRTRRPLQLAARSAILVAVSPVLFVASGIHGDRVGVAVALGGGRLAVPADRVPRPRCRRTGWLRTGCPRTGYLQTGCPRTGCLRTARRPLPRTPPVRPPPSALAPPGGL